MLAKAPPPSEGVFNQQHTTTATNTAAPNGIAAALANVGQGFMLSNRNDGTGAPPPNSTAGIPDLTGLDAQAQVRHCSPRSLLHLVGTGD